MFTKESLYINAIKYDSQLKLDYKKLNNEEIIDNNNSVFLIENDTLPSEVTQKINSSQEEIDFTYISTLLISDTTKLVPKSLSSKIKDCEIAKFNNEFDIAVLKTTLFETQNYFAKTGIDYIYSAFHIMNLHIEKKVCKNELLVLLYNNKAFILILNQAGIVVFNEIVDLPTFDSVKKTHFYDDNLEGQKLFDEIYYLELNEIIQNTLTNFYEKKNGVFVEKITILYVLKQLNAQEIEQLAQEFMLKVDYQPINIDEEVFELSRDKHLKKSFIKPRKKKKKRDFKYLYVSLLFVVLALGGYKIFTMVDFEKLFESKKVESVKVEENITTIPDHVTLNDKIEKRIKAVFNTIPKGVMIKEMKISPDDLEMKVLSLKEENLALLKPAIDTLYKTSQFSLVDPEKKVEFDTNIITKNSIELNDTYRKFEKEYITDEVLSVERVTEQLKILMPENAIIKFLSNTNRGIMRFAYTVNILVKEPKEFFNLVEEFNAELYSINIAYPIMMMKTEAGIEVEFNLEFNQLK